MKIKKSIVIIVFMLILAVGGYFFINQPKAVSVVPVEIDSISDSINAIGVVKVMDYANVSFELPYTIKEIRVREGEWVKKGQTLLTFDQQELLKQIDIATIELEMAKSELRYTKGVSTDKNLINGKRNQVQLVETRLLQLDESLKKTVLTAPMSGWVTRIHAFEGVLANLVSPDGILLEIQDLNTKYIEVNVPELYLSRIAIGQRVEILSKQSEQTLLGKIDSISLIASKQNENSIGESTIKCRVLMDKKMAHNALVSGMTVDAKVTLESVEQAKLLPAKCIVSEDGKYFVYTVKDELLKRVPIDLGISNTKYVQIISDALSENDTVVYQHDQTHRENQRVKTTLVEKDAH